LSFAVGEPAPRITSFQCITKSKEFSAGSVVKLKFNSESKSTAPQLFVSHSYGKTLLGALVENGNYVFTLPKNYSEKTGNVSWFLIQNNKSHLSGTIQIKPNRNTKTVIENYLGPRKIIAGGKEFSMMVVVPTDGFDNPKADDTSVKLQHQFLQNITSLDLRTKNFIAWYNIYSPNKSGKILVSTSCDDTQSKELETDVYPNIATDFTINYTRNHDYADGNQITTFSTSIIRDQFGNIVSDGTLVYFVIRNKEQLLLKTFGTTISGVATAQTLHPDHPDMFVVKAYVVGVAESNSIAINYKPIANSFDYTFKNQNRTLVVGPIKSFMKQLVPDGINVEVNVFQQNKRILSLKNQTSKGVAIFDIPRDIVREGNYWIEIKTLGITQKTSTLRYDH
jgi:hypothetical protein